MTRDRARMPQERVSVVGGHRGPPGDRNEPGEAFPCSRCGACCRVVGAVPELADLDRGDGACRHLVEGDGGEHGCAIYADRPALCRVDESRPPEWTVERWHEANAKACDRLHLAVYGGQRQR